MRIDKFALWTAAPTVLQPKSSTQHVVDAIDRVTKAIKGQGSVGAPPTPATPSPTALRIIRSLNPVRDALCDLGAPSAQSSNAQIEHSRDSAGVREIVELLDDAYPKLLDPYQTQFRSLVRGDREYDPERRERLAELVGVELLVMATVTDGPPPEVAVQPDRATKRR